ncbi:MAG: leucine--tRNA ligase, partial [Candidatus Microthrix parvicella]
EAVADRPRRYVLDMFPYPSGAGLHVGHPFGYISTDVYARYRRTRGDNVLHAMGYDAFGLPAEQFAVRTGAHPRTTTEDNIATMRRQLRRIGLGHDARRSVATTDVEFYRWTQWVFTQIFESWFDTEADVARPIAELLAAFESGERPTPDGRAWNELAEGERRAIIDDHRLVYSAEMPVNWCPGLGTVLANEEVTAEGRSDIGNYPVFRRNMRQWVMRITSYSDRLLADLDLLDWPEPIKVMQRNWIGRSTGANVCFATEAGDVEVFTTRPDTLFGATFVVLAPEHPMVDALVGDAWPDGTPERWTQATADGAAAPSPHEAVEAYRASASAKTDRERQEDRQKSGVAIGAFATNPVNGEQVPIFVADYVLMGYGTGAIMAVPAGDERDFEFARDYGLQITAIQQPPAAWFEVRDIEPSLDTSTWPEAFVGEGEYVGSADLNGGIDLNGEHTIAEAVALINGWLESVGRGEAAITYRLRDWLFSRQRYWGEPFPIVWDEHGPRSLPDSELPVQLPEVDDYSPQAHDPNDADSNPVPPLGRVEEWVNVDVDLGDGPQTYRRELNVMPQWAGSCWYELRYLDPTNTATFVDPDVEAYWMGPRPGGEGEPSTVGGVDLYVGGVEHAVLHLLYARFWHKVLFDLGHVSGPEPFHRLVNQGYIQAYAFTDARGQYVEASEVTETDDGFFFEGQPVNREYGKMGKSLKNMVTPDEMYDAYGADTFRLYELSGGPLESSRPWSTRDVVGMQRFLQRLWRNLVDEDSGKLTVTDESADDETRRLLARTVAGVGEDLDALHANTAIAKLIELNNHLTKAAAPVAREVAEPMVQLLGIVAPHLGEELWAKLGHATSVVWAPFPTVDEALLVEDTIELPVQVNGKVRGHITVAADADQATMTAAALAVDNVAAHLEGAAPRKVIVVPGRMVNVVV